MRGLLRRLKPDRAGTPEPAAGDTATLPAAAAEPTSGETATLAATPGGPGSEDGHGPVTPAGVAPEDLAGDRPDTRRRGRLRRRLRHLRQVRELMLRDLGGLAYELHRAPVDDGIRERGTAVIGEKLERLAALDAERHELEAALGDVRSQTVLREAGVGGTCPACGEYFASDARFCASCGTRVDGRAPAAPAPEPASAPEPAPAPAAAHEPAPPEPEPATAPDAATAPEEAVPADAPTEVRT